MVVDDEKAIRENLSKALNFEEAGFEIIATAINGQDALDKLSLYKPDVIFLDVCMPILGGMGFLEALRIGEYKETIVVMLSGYSDFEYAKTALRYGVKAYLTKPIDEDEIFSILAEVKQELIEKDTQMQVEQCQVIQKSLLQLFHNGDGERRKFKNYIIMHCFVLSLYKATREVDIFHMFEKCMKDSLGDAEYSFFRSRGSIYTFMISKKIDRKSVV